MAAEGSLYDTGLVAYFQLVRAMRTRSALALATLYALFSAGSALAFVNILHELEKQVARTLRVPTTQTPGAMMEALKNDVDFRTLMLKLVGDQRELLDWALNLPVLTLTHFWTCLGFLPILAAAAGADALSNDAQTRSLRFELVRTGRLELVVGRFVGQAALLGAGLLVGDLCVWLVAMLAMTGNPPVAQLTSLLEMTPRLWAWSLPALGVGLSCSMLTNNVNVARVLALAFSQGSWILWGMCVTERSTTLPQPVKDLLLPLLPQSWMLDLWGPGGGWAASGVALVGLGCLAGLAAYPWFKVKKL